MRLIGRFFREIGDTFLREKRGIFYLSILLFFIFISANLLFYFTSTFPASCKICHYMKPYYDQWRTSNHNNYNCLKCHKFRPVVNMINTLKYVTNTYNPRPIAVIEDKRCLNANCHPGALSEKVKFKGSILFDHQNHLGKIKRGEKLKCVSCHSQIVQGEHIAVTEKVCFLCHFKGATRGQSMTGCPSCHGTPTKIVEHEGFSFSHESYLKIGVACNQCHIDVASGSGDVPLERCNSCHVERAEKAQEPLFIHKVHVTNVGINCFKCHEPIEHGEVRLIQALEVRCENCHAKLHASQKELYMGASGRGVADTPSRMFAAQVACDGCHKHRSEGEKPSDAIKAEIVTSRARSCVECHGKGYDLMLYDWIRKGANLIRSVESAVSFAERIVEREEANKNPRSEEVVTLMNDAIYNFRLVQSGKPAHNIDYSYRLLKEAWEQSELAIRIVRPSNVSLLPAKPEIFQKMGKYCTSFCHDRIGIPEELTFKEMGISFPHSLHSSLIEIDCTVCHSPEKHKMRIITKEGCMECHHGGEEKCGRCHHAEEKFYTGNYKTFQGPSLKDIMFQADLPCTSCHDLTSKDQSLNAIKQKCIDCHDEGYGKMLIDWEREAEEKDVALTVLLDNLAKALEGSSLPRASREKYMKELQALLEDQGFLNSSNPVHNYMAAREIYENLIKRAKEIEKILEKKK
ncbi:MAG: cytochrome c3 family protein [Acidobacteriota bacterium]